MRKQTSKPNLESLSVHVNVEHMRAWHVQHMPATATWSEEVRLTVHALSDTSFSSRGGSSRVDSTRLSNAASDPCPHGLIPTVSARRCSRKRVGGQMVVDFVAYAHEKKYSHNPENSVEDSSVVLAGDALDSDPYDGS